MDVHLRWYKKNTYSLAVLAPLLPQSDFVLEPVDGIMIYSFSTPQKESIYSEVDSSDTDSIYIAGGPHPSGAVEDALKHFDYVVVGEGEETLPELVNTIRGSGDIAAVKGIAYMENGKLVRTPARLHVNLDNYPCFDPDGLRGPIEISRGCPWGCKYCQTPRLFGSKVRHRSIDTIIKYAKHYNDLRFTSSNAFAYGGNGIKPEFDKVEKLLSSLASLENKKIYFGTFPSEVRPEFVTDKSLELITQYCTNETISLGAQSGSERILKAIWRGHSTSDVIDSVERCFTHGIIPAVDFIIGFPEESEEEQLLTVEMIKYITRKGGKVRAHYLTPLPSTPYENTQPSPVSKEVHRVLGRLAQKGKVIGSWE
ncbi:TIGR04013 family B12-binding domain/radical SAM domain-containing protein [Methanohalophilus sp.]|uniref:TIGR04013 family B12-binding domain/radical SAM domain-containing protein n=1 Tax=Methanohalophilus sp. TaxID=1966352 RepID=UPI00262B4E2C|nr:TIGR04013 family B12-binding domain/radical SAM domain-containing protein [Methanohalophilus sp.]MDK2892607.1 hypothetical protein [Methanohalophilus sp.]